MLRLIQSQHLARKLCNYAIHGLNRSWVARAVEKFSEECFGCLPSYCWMRIGRSGENAGHKDDNGTGDDSVVSIDGDIIVYGLVGYGQ